MAEEKNNLPKQGNQHAFNPFFKSINEFFNQRPVRSLMDSIDEFFDVPFPTIAIPIDMYETDTKLVISADIPGVKKEQISIHFLSNRLTIGIKHVEETEEKNEVKHYYYKKHSSNHSSRTVILPYPVNEKDVKASYSNGVLRIEIPIQKQKQINIEDF